MFHASWWWWLRASDHEEMPAASEPALEVAGRKARHPREHTTSTTAPHTGAPGATPHHPTPRRTARPRLLVIQDHASVFVQWRQFANASVLHVDKHDDLELPKRRFTSCNSSQKGLLDNNNFLLAAGYCGILRRVLWLQPAFECGHCAARAFSALGTHTCEIGRNHSGDFLVRRTGPGWEFPACGASGPSDVASKTTRLNSAGRLEMSATDIRSFKTQPALGWWGVRPPEQEHPWLLDIDLDFFVDDTESPKMRGMPDVPFDGRYQRRFNVSKLVHLQRWVRSRGAKLRRLAMYELLIQHPPKPMRKDVCARRVAQLDEALRHHARTAAGPPAVVTLVRSNEGGYTPIEATPWLEAMVLGMLRRVYPSFRRVPTEYVGDNTLNGSDSRRFARWFAAARVTAPPTAVRRDGEMSQATRRRSDRTLRMAAQQMT